VSYCCLSIEWSDDDRGIKAGVSRKLGEKTFGGRYYYLVLGRVRISLEGIR
jgi:hypothetical protein